MTFEEAFPKERLEIAELNKTIAKIVWDESRSETIKECAEIAEAIDSGRGNEKEIAKAIRSRVA